MCFSLAVCSTAQAEHCIKSCKVVRGIVEKASKLRLVSQWRRKLGRKALPRHIDMGGSSTGPWDYQIRFERQQAYKYSSALWLLGFEESIRYPLDGASLLQRKPSHRDELACGVCMSSNQDSYFTGVLHQA
jgi:hypothetical protein